MADNKNVQGSVTLRKLRTGQTAQVVINVTKQLFQLYEVNANGKMTVAPDWTQASNQPVCTVKVTGDRVTVESVAWEVNGVSADKYGSVSDGALTITQNLVEPLGRTNGTLTARIKLKDSAGQEYEIEKSEAIRIQQSVENGYFVRIDASTNVVDESTKAVLTCSLYLGTTKQDIDGTNLKVKWYKGNTSTTAITGSAVTNSDSTHKGDTLTVTADDVSGMQLFVARAYNANNEELDAESVNVTDASDQYRLAADITPKNGGVAQTTQKNATRADIDEDCDSCTVAFRVVNSDGTAYAGTSKNWKTQKFHAETAKLIGGSSSTATSTTDTDTEETANTVATNTISVYDGDYILKDGNENERMTEVIVTATCDL